MPRTKVKLAFIENNKARKSSFIKRKESLKKKMEELCILCGVDACAILYGPYEPELELWPDDMNMFQYVLSKFLNKPAIERSKLMLNQDSYIKDRISKVKEQINKQVMANREIVKAKMLSECLSGKLSLASMNLTDLNELVSYAGNKISEIEERIELLKSEAPAVEPPSQSELPQPQEVVGGSNTANYVAAEGTDVDSHVPVMENPGGNLDDAQNTDWYPPDWISHQDDGFDLVPGVDMMKSYPEDPNYFVV